LRLDDVTDDLVDYELGAEIKADIFEEGEIVDVIGVTKGKGFAGSIKRHHFKGQSATHGTQAKHRSPGAIGACATPARVFKGTRMAGHLGHRRVTTLNLKVIKADPERNLLLIRGAVPGPKGSLLMVRSGIRLRRRSTQRKAG
jgi:large subunit ribosomal protein L3